MPRLIAFLLVSLLSILTALPYDVFVTATGEIVKSQKIPQLKRKVVRSGDRIVVTYTFDSIRIVTDEQQSGKVKLQPQMFGLTDVPGFPVVPSRLERINIQSLKFTSLIATRVSSKQYELALAISQRIVPFVTLSKGNQTLSNLKVKI